MYQKYIKRWLDIIISLVSLIILSPILLIIAILIRVKLGSPVLFKQKRPGKNEKIFELYKFRSMTDERDENGKLLSDEVRLTNFGKKLRASSLDELPELFNVLKGDMSLIGPRPLLVSYLPLYTKKQHRRHEVMPGLVGLAGVKGRNNQSWDSKFKYDLIYVENISFLLDLTILLKAFEVVFKRKGVNADGYSSGEPFKGNIR